MGNSPPFIPNHQHTELLRDFPRIGHAGIDPGTAEWVVRGSPYVIVYEVHMDHDELVILAVFHGSRSRT
jgi:plasmid stabilization system protein ParE